MLNYAAGTPATGYNLTRSLRLRASASAYLNRTPATTTNQQIWTWSAWVKRGGLAAYGTLLNGYNSAGNQAGILFWVDDTLAFDVTIASLNYALRTTQVFRDPSAWYHIVYAIDTTQATDANRVKLYVNGTQVTAFSGTYPPQNSNLFVNSTNVQNIGRNSGGGNNFDGYLAEVNFIDGQALTPSSFGSTNSLTGVWQAARFVGTYGTNGFYLPFTDNSALTTSSNVGLGKDFSGNGNYWTTNNISITAGVTHDSMTDVPTLTSATAANFAVLNPLAAASAYTVSNGNLNYSGTASTTASYYCRSTMAIPSGKFYFEFVASSLSANALTVGIQDITLSATTGLSNQSTGAYGYFVDGSKETVAGLATYGASWGVGDVIGVAFDSSAGSLTFYKNNTSQGVAFTGITGSYCAFVSLATGGSSKTIVGSVNFGQQPFTYTPPSGFVALNTYNLPTSAILKGNTVMDATLYTGTAATLSVVNAAAFKPDLVWIKNRSAADDNQLVDSVRGVTLRLISNTTNAEGANAAGLTAFNSNGFTVGSDANYNRSGSSLVGWQWQAGQGSSSSNTDGTITSQVSVNASAGFSVVTYTGDRSSTPQTVGHGLGVAPAFIIFKARNNVINWLVYHQSLGNTKALYLNLTDAAYTTADFFNSTSPTSTVFTIDKANENNGNAYTMVAYCWTPIAGFSAFGKYTANGLADDGPFIYTGFRPKFIMVKNYDAASTNWTIIDTSRDTYNGMQNVLLAESSAAETVGTTPPYCDALANGFKLRSGNAYMNYSTTNYIYMAFAENPFKNSLAR